MRPRPLPPQCSLTGLGRPTFADLYLFRAWPGPGRADCPQHTLPAVRSPAGRPASGRGRSLGPASPGLPPGFGGSPSALWSAGTLGAFSPLALLPHSPFLGTQPPPTPAHALGSAIGHRWWEPVTEATALCPVTATLSPTHCERLPWHSCFTLSPQKAARSFWELPVLPLPPAGRPVPWGTGALNGPRGLQSAWAPAVWAAPSVPTASLFAPMLSSSVTSAVPVE